MNLKKINYVGRQLGWAGAFRPDPPTYLPTYLPFYLCFYTDNDHKRIDRYIDRYILCTISFNRGVKFPNKLLPLHVSIFLQDVVNQKSTTQIVKTFTRPAYHFTHKCERASGFIHP